MVKIVWSEKSKNDLKSIFDFISQNSIFFAKKTRSDLIKRTQILKDYPNIGRIVPEFGLNHIRELIYGNYRIIYKTNLNNFNLIEIVTIWHASMDLNSSNRKQDIF